MSHGTAFQLIVSPWRQSRSLVKRQVLNKSNMTTMETYDASKNKLAHIVYRVGDLEKTKAFYCKYLGMKLLRERDIPEGKYKNAFLGYGSEKNSQHFSIELTYNYGVHSYRLGNGFVCMGIALPQDHFVWQHYSPSETKTTIRDMDGYCFELYPFKKRDPIYQLSFQVEDLEKSVSFYRDALGMNCFKTVKDPKANRSLAYLGYGTLNEANECIQIVLIFNQANPFVDIGEGYGQIAIAVEDVYAAAEHIKERGFTMTRNPGPVEGIGTRITAIRDPNGYKVVLVDQQDLNKELGEE